MFSVIYHQLFRTRLFRIPRYFKLIVLSLHLKSTLLFRTCQKQSTYIRAQLETYCILFELEQNIQRFFNATASADLSDILYLYLISVFLHTVLYFIKKDSLLPILRFPGYFEIPLFRTFFHFPRDFEIAGFNCNYVFFLFCFCFLA